ncbi:MAG: hypothetical protein H3C34_13000 [Caldilineaceae bacterium]|nr:hypothetical protein [Caldilineaceae bacterium]
MVEQYPTLLVTKLYVPRLRTGHVSRAPLLAVLDAASERKLTLIAAAAGSGKTTLVADWCSRSAGDICWLSLDREDNDLTRFLSYVVAAIQLRRPAVGQELLAALQSPQPPAAQHALHALINQLAGSPEQLFLVLDDYHVIENPAIHDALAFLLEHQPQRLHLLLLSRMDPPLPLARLRASRELLELRGADLKFSLDDTGRFLNETMQLDLPAPAITALETRTEGWIAGLQLAAIALQAQSGDRQAFVRNFTGSHRFVLDYLIEEVLAQQPTTVRRFLLQTSILGRLQGALCDAVTGSANGQAMLEYLEKHNLFVVPLDNARTWYRYHHLFADLLRARLQAEEPELPRTLQQRAAIWHAQNGLPEAAVGYALAARDFDQAADLIVGDAAGVTRRGEVTTVLDWYLAFPADYVAGHPRLSLQFGLAFALNGRWEEAEHLLANIEREKMAAALPSESLLLTYLVATYRLDANRLAALAAAASARSEPDRVAKLVLALVISLTGDLATACRLLAEAQNVSEQQGDTALALTILFHRCRLHVFLGDLHQTHALAQHALARVQEPGGKALPYASLAYAALVRVLIEWNELDQAIQNAQQALQLGERSGFVTGVISSAHMMLAEVKQARGDSTGSRELAELALECAGRYDPPAEVAWLQTYQARLWLQQGNVAAAAAWLRSTQERVLPASLFYPSRIQAVTEARVLLAQRKLDEAIARLTSLVASPRDLLTVEALALLALARQAQGDGVHALLALEQALEQAAVERRVRIFLELGAPMASLLSRFCASRPEHRFAQELLALFPAQPAAEQLVEPLTARELDVLRLIVAGHSNEEIARHLTLAVSTVKWYINSLYGKLQVKTRGQAIARARALRLLGD